MKHARLEMQPSINQNRMILEIKDALQKLSIMHVNI